MCVCVCEYFIICNCILIKVKGGSGLIRGTSRHNTQQQHKQSNNLCIFIYRSIVSFVLFGFLLELRILRIFCGRNERRKIKKRAHATNFVVRAPTINWLQTQRVDLTQASLHSAHACHSNAVQPADRTCCHRTSSVLISSSFQLPKRSARNLFRLCCLWARVQTGFVLSAFERNLFNYSIMLPAASALQWERESATYELYYAI